MRRAAFSLVELLVVIAIIVALLSILMPSLSRAMLGAQVAQCASNMRQTGIATMSYAQDSFGILPRHDFSDGIGRNPNAMPRKTAEALAQRGLHWELWFCPTRDRVFGPDPTWKLLTTPIDDADAMNQLDIYGPQWLMWPSFWWVPRQAGNGPCPSFNGQTYELLPTRTSHPAAATMPIVSDFMQTWSGGQPDPSNPKLAWGGHSDGRRIININRGYLSGGVDRRTPDEVDVMIEAGLWWNWY